MRNRGFEIRRDGARAEIVLDRPDEANSLIENFWVEFPDAIQELDRDGDVRVAILRGEGRNFCSGIDVALLERFLENGGAEIGRFRANLRLMVLRMHETMSAMEQARFPIIAVVQGACIGGGLDLASGCDLRVATADAYFCVQEIHMGLVADLGVLQRLSALIPPAMVRELAFTGRRLKADEATRLGFVNRVAPDIEASLGVARELAADISAKSPLAIWGTKEILNDFDRRRIEDGLRYVAAWNSGMFMPEDVQKSVAAAKRKQPTSYRNLLPVDAPAIPQGRTTEKGLTDVQ
jgi:enoyl-CoA hydratase/carnithine racemase